ncbi:HdeD family acid-resistance protein [Nocardioides iriomotensis]|uniref:Uncharacterized protein n=1 Tax=Nocardioides iriomotensis TaxID=715784 RepID=A0A4V1Z2L1_9ACTN|nr:DUF308 domain-containing protein [Nocardioides iriomotensis]RYU14786.1 hypothetical protein ETU37_02015 [Nocardioides iriomotensis]
MGPPGSHRTHPREGLTSDRCRAEHAGSSYQPPDIDRTVAAATPRDPWPSSAPSPVRAAGWPGPALLVVVAYSIAWMLLFRGSLAAAGSISSREYLPYWGLVLVTGVLEAVVALILLTRPDITLNATVLAIGFATMLYGALETVAAFEVRNLPARFDDLTEQAGTEPTQHLAPIGAQR